MVTIDARRRIDRTREASKPASQTGRQAANLAGHWLAGPTVLSQASGGSITPL